MVKGGKIIMRAVKIAILALCVIMCFQPAMVYAWDIDKTNPTVIYRPENRDFMCVYDCIIDDYGITNTIGGYIVKEYSQYEDYSFKIYSTDSQVSASCPAFDSVDNRCLVIWAEGPSGDSVTDSLYGAFVSNTGEPEEMVTVYENVYGNVVDNPSLAFDVSSKRYLAVWEEVYDEPNQYIMGRILRQDGTPVGDSFQISDVGADDEPLQWLPHVVATGKGSFLVVWGELSRVSQDTWQEAVFGRIVYSDGTKGDYDIRISEEDFSLFEYRVPPSVAYDDVNDQFLVVWENLIWRDVDFGDNYYRIAMQMLRGDGGKIGGNSYVSEQDDEEYILEGLTQFSPSACFNSYGERFLVTWEQYDYNMNYYMHIGSKIYGRFIDSFDGSAGFDGDSFNISGYSWEDNALPSAAYNPDHSNFLVAYTADMDGRNEIAFRMLAPHISPVLSYSDTVIEDYIVYDLNSNTDLAVDILANGNKLGLDYGFSYDYISEDDYIFIDGFHNLQRDSSPYKKYIPQTNVIITDEYLHTFEAGEVCRLGIALDSGNTIEFNICIVDTGTGDTQVPDIDSGVYAAYKLHPDDEITIEFSEPVHEYSRDCIEEAVENNVADDFSGDVNAFWDSNNDILTIEYYGYEDAVWLDDVVMEIMDYSGNTKEVPIIIKIYP